LYRGHKILPYCPRCETALSQHELSLGQTEGVEDPSVYVAFDIVAPAADNSRRFLVWTTTPWTLVSNIALAVHPELDYVEVRRKDKKENATLILAESRLAGVFGADHADRWEI